MSERASRVATWAAVAMRRASRSARSGDLRTQPGRPFADRAMPDSVAVRESCISRASRVRSSAAIACASIRQRVSSAAACSSNRRRSTDPTSAATP